jgi:D-amino peptidase
MDVFVSVDMEGLAGVTTARQVTRGTDDYPIARSLMIEEANAAIAGAFDGGATHVVVSDSHSDMGNLIADRVDPRAQLIVGTPKLPWSMMAGTREGFACALFVGYHAGGGVEAAVMDHTFTGSFADVRVNGESWNETHVNAALAGSFGVPVGLVTGDDKCCEQADKRLSGVRTVAVKTGIARHVASNLSPELARAKIRLAATEAVRDAAALEPFVPEAPFAFEVDLADTAMADVASLPPGTERVGPRSVRFEADDFRTAMRAFLTWMWLVRTVAPTPKVL